MFLVVYRGGNSLAICLNTIAVLFLVELDNLAFSHGLDEKIRMEAEEFGCVSVTHENLRLIDAVRYCCLLTVPATLIGGVYLRSRVMSHSNLYILSSVPFMLVAVLQSVWHVSARGKACSLHGGGALAVL